MPLHAKSLTRLQLLVATQTLTHWANVLRTFGALKRGTGALQCPWRRAPVGSARSDSPIMSHGGDARVRFGGAQAGIHLIIRYGEGLRSPLAWPRKRDSGPERPLLLR